MKKRILALLLAFCCMPPAFCSCKGSGHRSEAEMEKFIKDALDEETTYESCSDGGELKDYFFVLPERGGRFTVTSYVYKQTLGAGEKGKWAEDVLIYYERDIAELPHNVKRRAELAAEFGVKDEDGAYGLAVITAGNYEGIEKAAQFIAALDSLYAFKEKKPEKFIHIDCGTIQFENCSVEGVAFSYREEKRLTVRQIHDEIAKNYILRLKRFGLTDESVPKELWDSVKV